MEVVCQIARASQIVNSDGCVDLELTLFSGDRIGGNEDVTSSREYDFVFRFSTTRDKDFPFMAFIGDRVKVTLERVEDAD